MLHLKIDDKVLSNLVFGNQTNVKRHNKKPFKDL